MTHGSYSLFCFIQLPDFIFSSVVLFYQGKILSVSSQVLTDRLFQSLQTAFSLLLSSDFIFFIIK